MAVSEWASPTTPRMLSGDVVYVELPDVGRVVEKGSALVEVESTKSVADVYAPIGGTVRAVNEALADSPEKVNQDPYGDGWFVEIEGDSSVPWNHSSTPTAIEGSLNKSLASLTATLRVAYGV